MARVARDNPFDGLGAQLYEAGMPKNVSHSMGVRLDSLVDVKEMGSELGELSAFLLRRGLLPKGKFMGANAESMLLWMRGGRDLGQIAKREDEIHSRCSWRPFESESDNRAIASFFDAVSYEFRQDEHFGDGPAGLPGWKMPPSRLANYFKKRGVRYALREEVEEFRKMWAVGGGEAADRVGSVVRGLPRLVLEDDVVRYSKMLSNSQGEITFRTPFPMRFAILPQNSTPDLDLYYLALVPEEPKALRRMQESEFLGRKENHLPGSIAFCDVKVLRKEGVGICRELQSDHDPRETFGLGLEEWPGIVRAAMNIDLAGMGLRYSVVPKASLIHGYYVRSDTRHEAGLRIKLERAYGQDHVAPSGYGAWDEVRPQLSLDGHQPPSGDMRSAYWVRELKD